MFSMYNANDVRHLAMLAGLQFLISNKQKIQQLLQAWPPLAFKAD